MSDRAQLYQYKGNRCSACGLSVQDMIQRHGTFKRMFELHHIDPSKKDENYNNLIKQNLSSKQINEIDKCVLLCRNCHGLVHAQDINVKMKVTLNYCGETVYQELNGCLVIDLVDKSCKFLCEEKLLVEPYLEQYDLNEQKIIFGVDLEDGKHLLNKVKSLKGNEVYSIYTAESKDLMFRATLINNIVKIENNISFGFFTMDGALLPKGQRFWYRNGVVLFDNDEVKTEGLVTLTIAQDKLL